MENIQEGKIFLKERTGITPRTSDKLLATLGPVPLERLRASLGQVTQDASEIARTNQLLDEISALIQRIFIEGGIMNLGSYPFVGIHSLPLTEKVQERIAQVRIVEAPLNQFLERSHLRTMNLRGTVEVTVADVNLQDGLRYHYPKDLDVRFYLRGRDSSVESGFNSASRALGRYIATRVRKETLPTLISHTAVAKACFVDIANRNQRVASSKPA
jgi:hypothetical protein